MFYKNKFISFFIFTIIFLILFSPFSIAMSSVYVWSTSVDSSSVDIVETSTSPIDLKLESGSAVLIEQSSGQILYEHNPHEQLRPASITKVMTILLIMEALDSGRITLDDRVPCSSNARSMGGSQIWLNETEQLTVDEMLKAICIVSANDCSVAMAEYLFGSEEAFVLKMNERAKELGMNNTCFKNSHGIDEDGHLTTAYDVSLMSRELLENHPDITNYTTIWMDTLREGKSQLVNTNKLVRNYQGCTGLKTGSTSLALYNLSASATKNDFSLISVIMKSPSSEIRFNEAKKLLDYGFNTFSYNLFAKAGDIVNNIPVKKGLQSNVNAVFKRNAGALTVKGRMGDIVQTITLEENVVAPVVQGQKLGEAIYSLDDNILSTTDIIAEIDVKKMSFINMSSHIYKSWFCLMRN